MLAPELANTADGFDAEAYARLARAEATHFWFVARNELIVGLVHRFFSSARDFLEIGCGNANVMRALARARPWRRLVGVDLHLTGLTNARKRFGTEVEFVQADARNIPMIDAFDLVGAFDVLEHVADDEGVLRGMRRACRAGGGTIVAVPQHPWLWSQEDELCHQRRYRRGEMEEKLQRNGFEVLFSSSYNSVLLPLMAVNRLFAWHVRKPPELTVERELRVGSVTNRVLSSALRAEVRLTLAGLRWPFGGSRVIAARAL
jgi:SAM-dependent methyltransferase